MILSTIKETFEVIEKNRGGNTLDRTLIQRVSSKMFVKSVVYVNSNGRLVKRDASSVIVTQEIVHKARKAGRIPCIEARKPHREIIDSREVKRADILHRYIPFSE